MCVRAHVSFFNLKRNSQKPKRLFYHSKVTRRISAYGQSYRVLNVKQTRCNPVKTELDNRLEIDLYGRDVNGYARSNKRNRNDHKSMYVLRRPKSISTCIIVSIIRKPTRRHFNKSQSAAVVSKVTSMRALINHKNKNGRETAELKKERKKKEQRAVDL